MSSYPYFFLISLFRLTFQGFSYSLYHSLPGISWFPMLNFIAGLLAFWFIEIFPFMLFKYALFTFFAGGIVPIDFFPEFLKPLAQASSRSNICFIFRRLFLLDALHWREGSINNNTYSYSWIVIMGTICSLYVECR